MLMQQRQLKLPSLVSDFELTPPDDQDPEAWLGPLDNRPTLFPAWPESTHVTLVAVVGGAGTDEVSRAFVITRKKALDELLDGSNWHRNFLVLFFRVLKQRVLPLVPGLTLESWSDD
jgi:hypothetical protein